MKFLLKNHSLLNAALRCIVLFTAMCATAWISDIWVRSYLGDLIAPAVLAEGFRLLKPTLGRNAIGWSVTVLCLIETMQYSTIWQWMATKSPQLGILLGAHFDPMDYMAYLFGGLVYGLCCYLISRRPKEAVRS